MLTRRHILAVPCIRVLTAQTAVSITYDGSAYRVSGWHGRVPDAGWESTFSIYAGDSSDAPAMLGSYALENGALTFRPRFPVSAGVRTKAIFRIPGSSPVQAIFDQRASPERAITVVRQVYPSADIVPANLLRLYIEFSAPMQRGRAWQHIHLLNRDGSAVDLPFLELDQELWDREGRRLTVLFDPGRIKRGVLPREESGSALVEGGMYTLVIDSDWRDADGSPLQSAFKKHYRVLPEARIGIDLRAWRVQPPSAGTRDPLMVDFPAPLDFALLHRLIRVEGVSGIITVERNETQWRLVPESPWLAGTHRLQVDTALEDVAGNRVGRPFDVDTFDPISVKLSRKTESIPFRIRPQ